MKYVVAVACLASLLPMVLAFSRLSMAQKQQHRAFVSLHAEKETSTAPDLDRIKLAGGGLPMVSAGDFKLFDPSTAGMLQACKERIAGGDNYLAIVQQDVEIPEVIDNCQAFLEDVTGDTFAKATSPVTATVLGRVPLITQEAPGDIQHVLLQLPKGFHYLEGQSISIIPPGLNEKGRPQKPRLYSIASTRYGELLDGTTVSVCVRRAEYVDPATGQVDPTKAGVCSNYLCDLNPGEKVQIAGPIGKSMLLPEDNNADLILVATGTGIAPFRGFLRRLFAENTVASHMYKGQAWLVLGVPVTGGLLYHDEFSEMMQSRPTQFQVTYAISREMQNKDGGKLYVQDVLKENASVVLERLEMGAHIYFCGLKGMMPGILDALESVATERGIVWKDYLSQLKKNGQWHVEVY